MDNKWKKIFEEPKNSKVWKWCVVISIVVIVAISYINNYASEVDKVQIFKESLPSIFTSIATGVLGAAFLNLVYRESENIKLNNIKSLKYDNMLASFFEALYKLDGKVRRDEKITAEFMEFKNKNGVLEDSFCKVRITYNYRTYLRNNYIKFKFERINEESSSENIENMQCYTVGINESLFGYEFYWGNDETDFAKGIISDDDYKVYDVYIESHNEDLIKEGPKENSSILEYTYKLPDGVRLDENAEVTIRFKVEFPMERESIMFLTHEFPTENTEVQIDYSAIKDKTNFYTMSVTGTIPVRKHVSQEEAGKELYEYTGWIIPKAGYIIAWWDEDEKFL